MTPGIAWCFVEEVSTRRKLGTSAEEERRRRFVFRMSHDGSLAPRKWGLTRAMGFSPRHAFASLLGLRTPRPDITPEYAALALRTVQGESGTHTAPQRSLQAMQDVLHLGL